MLDASSILPLAVLVLHYRKAVRSFQATASHRAKSQVESSLQMDLLQHIADSQRSPTSTCKDRAGILDLIKRLETINNSNAADGRGTIKGFDETVQAEGAKAASDTTAAAIATNVLIEDESVDGQWLLKYASNSEDGAKRWDFADSVNLDKYRAGE